MINLKEEERNGYIVSAEMKKLWAVELELLDVLLKVCKKHNLKIWAEGGTLLGTIRHHGFIPWDDDIDMAMLREDYDKLLKIAPLEFKAPYFFQSGYTDKNYIRGHSQLRKDGTTAILPADVFQDFHQGIFIDIFVYDNVPDDEEEILRIKQKANALKKKMSYYCYGNTPMFGWRYKYNRWKVRKDIEEKGLENFFYEYDNILKSSKEQDCSDVACMGFVFDFKHYRRNKHLYDETIYMPFEGILMPVPSGYDSILKTQFGNYMTPLKTPSMHGGFAVVDTEHPYIDYIQKLRKKYKKESYTTLFSKIVNKIKYKYNTK